MMAWRHLSRSAILTIGGRDRNVLPVLNNLLENREMALEDGRFLVAPSRYDSLVASSGDNTTGSSTSDGNNNNNDKNLNQLESEAEPQERSQLVRVHPAFRVIAIGVPVPPFSGNPLDPPLRSRFQSRRIDPLSNPALLSLLRDSIAPTAPIAVIQRLLSFAEALRIIGANQASMAGVERRAVAFHHLPYLTESGILAAARALELFPSLPLACVIERVYPWRFAISNPDAYELVSTLVMSVHDRDLKEHLEHHHASARHRPHDSAVVVVGSTLEDGEEPVREYRVLDAVPVNEPLLTHPMLQLSFVLESAYSIASDADADAAATPRLPHSAPAPIMAVQCVSGGARTDPSNVARLPRAHAQLLSAMLQSHCADRDICLIGARGIGKTYLVNCFASLVRYSPVETLFLYKDMSARDLLQRRTTSDRGETIWQDTPLVSALRFGRLAVLDGIHRLPPGTLGVLLRLVADREITLFDGTRFVRYDRYVRMQTELGFSIDDLTHKRIFAVHPAFRLLATATPPEPLAPWLNAEVMQMFAFHAMSLPSPPTSTAIVVPTSSSSSPSKIEPPRATSSSSMSIATLLATIVPAFPHELCAKLELFAHRTHQLHLDPMIQLEEPVSLRQLIRIAQRSVAFPDELHASVASACMLRFMPQAKRQAMLDAMRDVGIITEHTSALSFGSSWAHQDTGVAITQLNPSLVQVGSVRVEIQQPRNPELVPEIVFFEIPRHTVILEAMLKDWTLREHLLLVGNQGVGKNKVPRARFSSLSLPTD